jgi:hypothetical protein
MTKNRLNEYETLIGKLRSQCFENDKAAALIPKVKSHCADAWVCRNALTAAKADQRFLFRTN